MDFSSIFFEGNRRRLVESSKSGSIVISANGLLQASVDEAFPFRQESNFWYLTGLQIPDAWLVIDTEGAETLILPKRDAHRDQWEGEVDRKKITLQSGLENIIDYEEGMKLLKSLVTKNKKVWTLLSPPRYISAYGFYTNPAKQKLTSTLKRFGAEIKDIRSHIAKQRMIKQPQELEAIKQAIEITISGFETLAKRYSECSNERDAQRILESEFISRGGAIAYEPVIGTGKNAATIHYRDNNQPIQKTDLLLIDAAAKVSMYNADITRMFRPKNDLSKRQTDVYQSVLEAKSEIEKLVKTGLSIRKYEEMVTKIMAKKLLKLGLINDLNDEDLVRKYYPHRAGHQLGIDVHDAEIPDTKFSAGMVFTIEPGIYIPEENIGIRLEDNYYLSAEGLVNLSAKLSHLLG